MEYTIDELARRADTTVRSVRVYHERGLLPPPDVRGRVGYYNPIHLHRLQTIGRLLDRGMKLNGIRELLDAWDRGDGLAEVLGIEHAMTTGTASLETYRGTSARCFELAAHLIATGMVRPDALALVGAFENDCERLAARYAATMVSALTGTDKAVARMLAARAADEIVDRVLAEHPGESG